MNTMSYLLLWKAGVRGETCPEYQGSLRLANYVAVASNSITLPGSQFRHQRGGSRSEPLRLFSTRKFYWPSGPWVTNSIPCSLHRVYVCACKTGSHMLTCFMSCLSSPQLTGLSRSWLTPLEGASTVHARSHRRSLSLLPYQQPPGMLRTCPQILTVS